MNALKALVPALLLISACKKGGDVCKAETIDVSVVVNDTDGMPIDATVDIDGAPCAGSAGVYTCTAVVPVEDDEGVLIEIPNQVTAVNFPFNQPAAQRVDAVALAGPDCEDGLSMELRMLPAQK